MNKTWTNSDKAALARLFSSGVARELAHVGHSSLLTALLRETGLLSVLSGTDRLRDVFDEAFGALSAKDNRNEYIYKNAIAQRVLLGTHSLNTACMLSEFRAGDCKADVVILNGTSMAYEVKSERDNLDRLEKQLHEYCRVFDQVRVITCESHILALRKAIPDEVGIYILTDHLRISPYRPSVSNMAKVQPESIFESLQRREYLAVLQAYGVSVPEVANTRMYTAAKHLFARLTPEQAHQGMVSVLKRTRNLIPLREYIYSVPKSLKAVALSVPLNSKERDRFVSALNAKLDDVLN